MTFEDSMHSACLQLWRNTPSLQYCWKSFLLSYYITVQARLGKSSSRKYLILLILLGQLLFQGTKIFPNLFSLQLIRNYNNVIGLCKFSNLPKEANARNDLQLNTKGLSVWLCFRLIIEKFFLKKEVKFITMSPWGQACQQFLFILISTSPARVIHF